MDKKRNTRMRLYLDRISQTPLLSPREELRLAKKIGKSEEARRKLISANLRLVVSIAKEHARKNRAKSQNLTLFDLIHEGNYGLVCAAQEFDYKRGFKFSTLATKCIENAIKTALRLRRKKTTQVPEFFFDALQGKPLPEPGTEAERLVLCQQIERALCNLTAIERTILLMRFGFEDYRIHTLVEIGKKYGITAEQVRQLKNQALRALSRNAGLQKLDE